jgi:hypothetical protein
MEMSRLRRNHLLCHNGLCFDCGFDELKMKKKKYRWES